MQGFGTNQGNAAIQHLYFSLVLGIKELGSHMPEQYLFWTNGLKYLKIFGIMQALGTIQIFNKKTASNDKYFSAKTNTMMPIL